MNLLAVLGLHDSQQLDLERGLMGSQMDTKGERKTPLQEREWVVCGMSSVLMLTCYRSVAKILVGSPDLFFWVSVQ